MALGPFVLQVVGVYGPVPFLTCAALALLVALPLLPYWKTAPPIEHAADSGYMVVVVAAPLAMLAAFVCGLGEQVAFSFLPVYAVGAGVSAETGALWLSAFVIGNVDPAMADRLDGRSSRPARRAGRLHAGQRHPGGPAAGGVGAVAGDHRRHHAVGRHLLRHLSGRPGAARPALQRRRHRPRQHGLQHALHPGRPGRPAAHRCGDGRGRRSRPRLDARLVLCHRRAWPPCWRSAGAADNPAGS